MSADASAPPPETGSRLSPPRFGPEDRERLAAWFEARSRDFPWRRQRTPYRVWVSEIMLQQTRADTVVPYFLRWLDRFPTVEALAAAELTEVLAAWEGLGYYRRARSLHEAARRIVGDGGRLPEDEEAWRRLPGVGPYTAAAIAALTLGTRTVAVDGNVRRLGARLLASPSPTDAEVREALLPLVDERRPGRGSEALIELGATVCTPRKPACPACPLARGCRGRVHGPLAYPARKAARAPSVRRRFVQVHLRGEAVWLERRPLDGLLGGLWGLPQRDRAPRGRVLEPIRHAYSHFRLELVPVVVPAAPGRPAGADAAWMDAAARAAAPLSGVDRAVLALLRREGLLGSRMTFRVRFAETDQMGVAHHAAYVVWFEAARVEWMRERGLSYRELEEGGLSMAVSGLEVRYRSACRFDDLLHVECAMTELRSRHATFAYRLTGPGERLVATARSTHVPTDRRGRAVRLPPAWADALARHVGRIEGGSADGA